ncbi:hypothetical protein NDU88_004979 [Pleurodeles waltl]|uniref:Uncharacterized protein n=1 Tax=Pleurodeles waltl TaxID=8319 RepID=A0AAV7TU53_PLEWA|nr:hypothetical protein NDU88_004979 [Pleurodeles waltl]
MSVTGTGDCIVMPLRICWVQMGEPALSGSTGCVRASDVWQQGAGARTQSRTQPQSRGPTQGTLPGRVPPLACIEAQPCHLTAAAGLRRPRPHATSTPISLPPAPLSPVLLSAEPLQPSPCGKQAARPSHNVDEAPLQPPAECIRLPFYDANRHLVSHELPQVPFTRSYAALASKVHPTPV